MKVSHSEDYEALTEGEIWDLFCSGDGAAFEFVYEQHFKKLYNYGSQFTSDNLLVEDTIQELFIELVRRKEHLSKTDRITPYLYSAFRRKLLRNRSRSSKLVTMNDENSFLIEYSIESALIEEEEKALMKAKLKKAVDELKEKDREIIYLFYYENFSYEEIQLIQGFENVKSARNLLYKALKKLKERMLLILFCAVFLILLR